MPKHDDTLDKIRDEIRPIIEKYPEYSFMLVVAPDRGKYTEEVIVFGNSCLRCVLDFLVRFCIEERIDHLDEHISGNETRH